MKISEAVLAIAALLFPAGILVWGIFDTGRQHARNFRRAMKGGCR